MSPVFTWLLVAALSFNAGATGAVVAEHRQDLSPITRVVQLLQQLAKQIETEEKSDEDLYKAFVCWGQQVISQKQNSNAAATIRINELETYISDLDAGRIDLTTEEADLRKEIKETTDEIESMEALREKERKDFLDAEDEMTKGIAALKEAMEVLHEATKDHKDGVLLAVRSHVAAGMTSATERAASLERASEIASRSLDKADALFLRRLLTGDVPTWDWKKLNRKANFKMSYKARSFKIQAILAKMHQTFTINLQEATKKEEDAQATYDALHATKTGQLNTAKASLQTLVKETGARALSREEASTEADALKAQVAADLKFIQQTEEALATKKTEWKHRKELRAGEQAAISKAIYILHNDDARDLFKRSFSSQGYSLLQVSQDSEQTRKVRAVDVLRQTAKKTGDRRLESITAAFEEVEQVPGSNYTLGANESVKLRFQPVIDAIDKMLDLLQAEEQKDLALKEQCEKDRMEDTREAILAARAIDEMTDKISQLKAEIARLEKEIEVMTEKKAEINEQLKEATQIRKDEHAEWLKTDEDDKEAAATVQSAIEVLATFYKENGLYEMPALVQRPLYGEAITTVAGEAPPPPPTTWEAPYGGKVDNSKGIVAILGMIKEDIEKDRSDAAADETAAESKYQEFKTESETEMDNLQTSIDENTRVKGEKEGDVSDTKDARGLKKGELDEIVKKIKDVEPDCDYFAINYKLRVENRHIEIDGLLKAKAILMGGKFTAPPDPTRELKPGDAAFIAQSAQPRMLRGRQ